MASSLLLRLVPGDGLGLLIASFLDDCALADLSPRTMTNYEQVLQRFHWWCEHEGVPLHPEQHTAAHMRAFLRYLQQPERWGGAHPRSRHPMKVSTREAYQRVLVTFYNWLVGQEYIAASPLAKVPRPRMPKRPKVAPFTAQEIERLFTAAASHPKQHLALRNHAILAILLDTGLRNADLRNLTLDDVDYLSGEVIVRRGKGGKARTAFMGAACRRSVRRYALRVRGNESINGYRNFFLSSRDRKLGQNTPNDILHAIGKRAGIEDVHPHRCRHTFAINAVRAGMPLFQLQQILGHESLEMVRYYVELAEADVANAARMHSPLDWLSREG